MYNVETLKRDLFSLVGWRQNPDPNEEQLVDTELMTSTSGLYFNGQHPLLTFDNMYSVAPDSDNYTYTAFNATKTDYVVGEIVESGGNHYIRIKTDAAAQPITNTEFWRPFTPFGGWLREKTEDGIVEAVNDWFTKKSKLSTATNLLSRETIFEDGGDFDDVQTNTGKVVGQWIYPTRSEGVVMKINKISLQMSQNQNVTVKLFKKGTKTPIVQETFTYDQNGGVQWFTLTEPEKWFMDGSSMYFIGYDEGVITGTSINAVRGRYRSNYFPTGKFYNIQSFSVESDFTEMWNEKDVQYTTSTNYGLNCKIDVGCDYTEFIVEQKDLFKMAIAKKVAMKVLREFAFNPNALVNRNIKNIDTKMIIYEIDGASQSTPGNNVTLKSEYDKAIMAIQFDQSGIDKVCLPCRKRGVKYRTIK